MFEEILPSKADMLSAQSPMLSQAQASRMDLNSDGLEGIMEWDIVEYHTSARQGTADRLPSRNRLGKVVKVGRLT